MDNSLTHVYQILTANSPTPWYTEKLEPSELENKVKVTIFRQGIFSINNAHFTYKEIVGKNLTFDLDTLKLSTMRKEPWMTVARKDVEIESSALQDTVFHYIRKHIGKKICPANPGTEQIGKKWP